MESKVSYTLVGLFAILLGAALVVIVLWLSGGDYNRRLDTYYAYFSESVSGLSRDAPVKYRGVDVGKVTAIELAPDNPEMVRLTLQIQEGTPIKQDTRAQLSIQGVTGIAFLDLTGGSRSSPQLAPKGPEEVPVIATVPSLFQRIDTTLTGLVAQLGGLAQDAKALLSEGNRAAIKDTLANLDALSSTLAARRENLATALDSLASTLAIGQKASHQLGDAIAHFAAVATALQTMAEEFTRTGKEVNGLLAENRQGLAGLTAQTLPNLNQLLSELRQMTGNVNRLVQLLQQQPNALLFGRQAPAPGPGER